MKEHGQFINADQVLGSTENIEQEYRQSWLNEVKNRGVTENELEQALNRMKEDKMSPLEDQLLWLRKSGFKDKKFCRCETN